MQLAYNEINLDMIHLDGFERHAEYDGPMYLFHRIRFNASGIYNPEATSYQGTLGGTPTQQRGKLPADTDQAIRFALSQPRRELVITDGGITVLRTPVEGYDTDANNGPTPIVHSVIQAFGFKTWLVTMSFECCVNECPDGARPIVLSHRWSMRDCVSKPHYLTTRYVEGHAILRTDLMLAASRVPDDLRAALMHPCPRGCQIDSIDVRLDEANNRLDYSLVFEERAFNIMPAMAQLGVTKIEASQTSQIGKPSVEDVIRTVGGSAARGAGMLVQASGNIVNGAIVGAGVGALIAGGIATLDVTLAIASLVPRQIQTIIATVWGDNRAARKDLTKVALKICLDRLALTKANIGTGTTELTIRHDLMNEWAEVKITCKAGIDAVFAAGEQVIGALRLGPEQFIQAAGAAVGLNAGVINRNIMPDREDLADVTTKQLITNPAPRNAAGLTGRGTFVAKMVAQVLQDAGSIQEAPPAATQAINLPMQ